MRRLPYKAIDCLTTGKGPGKDGIQPKVLKNGKSVLLWHLNEFLCLCWEKGYIPHGMYDAIIVILYENKGDCSNCNNYCGISLLSIVGKAITPTILVHLKSLTLQVYPES